MISTTRPRTRTVNRVAASIAAALLASASAVSAQNGEQIEMLPCNSNSTLSLIGLQPGVTDVDIGLHRPDGFQVDGVQTQVSVTEGQSLAIGGLLTGFEGSCVVSADQPIAATVTTGWTGANGPRTPIYGNLSSSGDANILVGIPRDKPNGITSETILGNPNDSELRIHGFCNDADNNTFNEPDLTIDPLSIASFSSRGASLQTCDLTKPDVTAPGVSVFAGVETRYKGSGDRGFTPGLHSDDFGGGDVLVPLVHGSPDGTHMTSLVIQNLWFPTQAEAVFRDWDGKLKARGTIGLGTRELRVIDDPYQEFGLDDDFVGSATVSSGNPLIAVGRLMSLPPGSSAGGARAAGDEFSTTVPGYTTANATTEVAAALGFEFPEGSSLTYRAVNTGPKKATIRVTIGRLDGTTVSSKKYKLKKYAAIEIAIPDSEQGNALFVRTEVLKKGPVASYVEQILPSGEVEYYPGLSGS